MQAGAASATMTPFIVRRAPVVLACGLWAIAVLAQFAFNVAVGAPSFLFVMLPIWATHGLLLTWPLHEVLKRSDRAPALLRWAGVAAAVLAVSFAQAVLDTRISHFMVVNFAPPGIGGTLLFREHPDDPGTDIGSAFTAMIYFWVYACYAVSASLLRVHSRLVGAEADAQRAKLTALRLQLNPHFLFNALNSLSSLILLKRIADAERVTTDLASFLRAVLVSDTDGMVELHDEIEMIETYLDIERVRFPERLRVETDVPEPLGARLLPAFILQPLVENAVKYAVAPARRPVTIRISAALADGALRIIVADDGGHAGGAAANAGTGTGLANVRERLRTAYGDAAGLAIRIEPDGFSATLTLPAAAD